MSLESLQRRVASKIKQARKDRGLLQKDLEKFGLPVRQYQKIESGQLNLTLKTLFKVSKALDTQTEKLFAEDEPGQSYFKTLFHESPLGHIVWRLADANDPRSLQLFDYNQVGAHSVYRDLRLCIGKSIGEIFPKGEEQGVVKILFEVITTGRTRFVSELIRYDRDFPLTVFSAKFVKCGPDLAAAVFTDITREFLDRQEKQRRLPAGIEPDL